MNSDGFGPGANRVTSERRSAGRGIPLAARITLVLLTAVVVASSSLALFARHQLLGKVAAIEVDLAERNRAALDRVLAAELAGVATTTRDWSEWVDLYQFATGRDPGFADDELVPRALDRLQMQLILLLDSRGRVAHVTEHLRSGLPEQVAAKLARTRIGTGISGLLDAPDGPLLVAAFPVGLAGRAVPPAGTLVMGRRLDPARIGAELSVLPSTVLIHGTNGAVVDQAMQRLAVELAAEPSGAQLVWRAADLSDFRLFRDLSGAPAFVLETRMERSILIAGQETARLLLFALFVAATVALLTMVILVRRVVSEPLEALASHMLALRHGISRTPAPGRERRDEIGDLARRFEELEYARDEGRARFARFAAAVEYAGDAVAIMDADGRITYVNPQYERQTGFMRDEVVGRIPSHGRDSAQRYAELWATVRAGQCWSGLLESAGPDGRVRFEETTIAPILDADGQAVSFVAVMRDVTVRRRTEAELLALQDQLAQARRLEAIGQLAAGVAHEINTPTQYVGGNIRFLNEAFASMLGLLQQVGALASGSSTGLVSAATLRRLLAGADAHYLQAEVPVAIRQSLEGVERVGEIVKSMRELAHPAQDLAAGDLNDVVASAVRVAGAELQGVAEVALQLDRRLPPVPCLAGGLNQVLVNMLVNAAHAVEARAGGCRGLIRVSTALVDGHAEIRVADNGCGIPEPIRARIFDPFFTTKPVGRGTGQGLAIAHSVIKKQNGSIRVESVEGEGSCFIVTLPLGSPARVVSSVA
jgi:PAS domain S-box-containing protein